MLAVSQAALCTWSLPMVPGSTKWTQSSSSIEQRCEAPGNVSVPSQSLDQSKSQVRPSFRGGEKVSLVMGRATSHTAKVMEEFMAFFIICHHHRISDLFLLMLLAHQGRLGAVLHIISQSEKQMVNFCLRAEHAWLVITKEERISMN